MVAASSISEKQSNTLAAYDAIAPLYAEYSEKYIRYLESVDTLMAERMPECARLLDVGSGDGRRLKKLMDISLPALVIAVEPSSEMTALCENSTGITVHTLCADALDSIPEKDFTVITAMWNVFGHMQDNAARIEALKQMQNKLAGDGIIMLDVNNRHNQRAYGKWNVMKRRIIDALAFDETRGDAYYDWKIGEKSFPSSGHLFTPAEMNILFKESGLRVKECLSVNYHTGETSFSQLNGQLFYVLERA